MITITLIGTGRLSFNFMKEILKNDSLHLNQVFGRSKFRPKHISDEVDYVKDFKNLKTSDYYFICVNDNQISKISNNLDVNDKVIVHLSGSTDINVLSKHKNYGVFYPLQTFSYESELLFKEIPILIEGNNKNTSLKIKTLAKLFSKKVKEMNGNERIICHISATIANNFSNHMVVTAEKLLEKNNIDKNLIKPLIFETFKKLKKTSAIDAQTGPAIRNDKETIDKHINQLSESDFLNLYKIITKNIMSNEL